MLIELVFFLFCFVYNVPFLVEMSWSFCSSSLFTDCVYVWSLMTNMLLYLLLGLDPSTFATMLARPDRYAIDF